MDDTDRKIIALLRKDSRMPAVEIARHIGLTEGAVRARIKKLIEGKVIKKFTVDTEGEIKAIVLVATSPKFSTRKIAAEIKKSGIERVYEVSGNYDIVCFVQSDLVQEVDKLVERIRKIRGVMDTNTFMVLR